MFEREVLTCYGCGDMCRPGEFVYWCDPFTGEEVRAGGEPFHDSCAPSANEFFEHQDSYNLEDDYEYDR